MPRRPTTTTRSGGRSRLRWAAGLALLFLLALPVSSAASEPAGPDLTSVVVTPADLPPGFAASDAGAESFLSAADALTEALDTSPDLQSHGAALLERAAGADREFLAVVLLSPLSLADQGRFDAELASREAVAQIEAVVGGLDATALAVPSVGTSRLGIRIEAFGGDVVEELVVFRRGPVLALAGHAWAAGTTTTFALGDVARLLDHRLLGVTGVEPLSFRAPALLVPALTTHIPTPLDVSTDPVVAGTNLALSALALLLLTVSARLATRMADDHEEQLARLAGAGILQQARQRVVRPGGGWRTGRLAGVGRPLAVAGFYGITFAALDATWDPFSVTGVWLLVSMTIACGVVGVGDDLVSWRIARHMGLPASLGVRPSGAIAAIASTIVSRATSVVPGLMFGTPEALRLDEAVVPPGRGARLAAAGTIVLVAVGGAAWAATVATDAAARSGTAPPILGGIEALLLLIYASVVQNLFASLLGLAGSAGDLLRRRSPVAWGAALLAVTFLFWHTLLNPAGDPRVALASRNVQVILGIVGAFSVATAGAWLLLRLAAPRAPATASAEVEPASDGAGAPTAAPPATQVASRATPAAPLAEVHAPVAASAAPGSPPAAGPPLTPLITSATVAVPAPAFAAAAFAAPAFAAQAAVNAPAGPGADVILESADGRVRGPVLLRFAGPWVSARVVLIDRTAAAQQRVFGLLSGLAVFGTAVGYARWLDGRQPPDAAILGLVAMAVAWTMSMILSRVWVERHRVVHVAVFPLESIGPVTVGRNWAVAFVLAILLTPVVGILYLVFAHRRIVRIRAPFEVGRARSLRLRLGGSEEEGRRLERLAIGGRLPA